MKTNKLLKTKLNIIGLSLIFSIIYACGNKAISPEAERFENMLQTTQLTKQDSVNYIYWSRHSCGGCRSLCAQNMVLGKTYSKIVILITPAVHEGQTTQLNTNQYFIDTKNIFGKKYIGIDNVGIIKSSNGRVYSIKNYNPDEMEQFKIDLIN